MLFNSLGFIIFFPIVVLLYFVLPKKIKNLWLLAASYYFYMNWNAKYGLLILFCTLITYGASMIIQYQIDRGQRSRNRTIIIIALTVIFGLLFYFKYVNFTLQTVREVAAVCGVDLAVPEFDIVLPVGISFFTFQAAGYLIDVYRQDVRAEKNFLKYALFVSFFPQLVAGPIERSRNLLEQLNKTYTFQFERVRDGIFMMLWGYFMKMVVADRAAILVDQVFNNYQDMAGSSIVLATVLFAFQIYGDFGGYSMIAIGASKVLGIGLMQNFNSPYFAASSAEFWRRWHISLNTWFRDYLYIPLGGSRRGKRRKYINLIIVFLISGLWHGAQWNYVVWGGLNGLYQIIGSITGSFRKKITSGWQGIAAGMHKVFQILFTFVITDFAWLFFRANNLTSGIQMVKKIISSFSAEAVTDGTFYTLGLDRSNLLLLMAAIILLLLIDGFQYFGVSVRSWILQRGWLIRTAALTGAVMVVLIFGIWGNMYDAQSFIYFQF